MASATDERETGSRDERLQITALGADVILRPTGAELTPGDLTFDVIGRPRGLVTQRHVHSSQQESYEVISGAMRLDLAKDVHILRPGDRMHTPAGVGHRQRPHGPGPGHVRVTFSPAGQSEDFLRRLAEMSASGQFNRLGLPRPVAGARLVLDFADAGRATGLPLGVQQAFARAVLRFAGGVEGGRQPGRVTGGLRRLWRPYAFVDEWEVSAPPARVYAALADGTTYPKWWRPVYIDVKTEGPAKVGAISHQHFKGRLPYHLHTRTKLVRLEPDRLIEADVEGDLRGRGIWTLTPSATGTHIRFEWTVYADRLLLRALTPLLRPAFRANHNWAISRAMEGLEPYLQAHPGE